jgi:hypothetical protein
MINLFDVSEKTVKPSVHCYAIPWLKRVMDDFPGHYLEIYKYIFYMTCPDSTMNPYVQLPEDKREEVILLDLKPEFYPEDLHILETIEKCRIMYETPTLRMWRGQKKMVEKIANYLDITEITEGKDSNAMAIDRFMKQGLEYVEILNKVGEILKEEQSKVRGNVKVRYDQLPTYVNSKEDKEEE